MNKFAFGKNWQKFLDGLSKEAIKESADKLEEFLGENLEGKTFLDLGSGSGIHSLSALELGAERVVSIDADPESVECALRLRADSVYKEKWQIQKGSLLDVSFLNSLGTYSVVYCWGVAHHTGDMWQALENISKTLNSGGVLFVAIYNYVEGRGGSRLWWQVKNFYNKSPYFMKKIMEFFYISYNFLILFVHLKNPFRIMRDYKKKRGMSWSTDLVDWLGGFPYEYASVKQGFDFFKERGFQLVNIKTTNYIGCNQFLFLKK